MVLEADGEADADKEPTEDIGDELNIDPEEVQMLKQIIKPAASGVPSTTPKSGDKRGSTHFDGDSSSSDSSCTVPFSLFADPERILRRLYVFAEEPCKSTNATSELCSPVFKEAQPRPSEHSNLEYHINNLNLYLYVFGLFSIFCNKSYPTRL